VGECVLASAAFLLSLPLLLLLLLLLALLLQLLRPFSVKPVGWSHARDQMSERLRTSGRES